MNDVLIIDAIRTPIGKKRGSLAGTRADALGATVLDALVERTGVDPATIEDVVAGCVTQTSEQGANVARNIVLTAGLPVSVPGTSVNRLCGSSLQAFAFAAQAIGSGQMDCVAALGTESMNRVAMGSDFGGFHPDVEARFAMVSQGISAELMADKFGLSRNQLDEYSLMSQSRAMAAVNSGAFDRELVPVEIGANTGSQLFRRDETPRESSLEKLSTLKPAFKDDGLVTAGNSSQISDGAAGLLLMSERAASRLGAKPRARFVTSAVIGVDPTLMLHGPIPATRLALDRAGLSLGDMGVIEINEAFASVALACGNELGFDWAKTNIRGGAVALGHPLGATGARLVTTALHLLEDRDERYALITLCIGFGQGQAIIIERLS